MNKEFQELLEEIKRIYENNNGWRENKVYIKNELKNLKADVKDIKESLSDIKVDIAGLKVKASIWGLMGGMIPVIIMIFYFIIRSSL